MARMTQSSRRKISLVRVFVVLGLFHFWQLCTAGEPLFESTLDDAGSVFQPVHGDGAGAVIETSPMDDFVVGQVGNALRMDVIAERILVPQKSGTVTNLLPTRGTMDFWYQPFYDHDDDNKYTWFGTAPWPNPGSLHVGKHNSSNENALFIVVFDATGVRHENNVEVQNFFWRAGDWVQFRVTWDFTVAPGERNVRVYMNGVEAPITTTPNGPPSTGPLAMPPPDPAAPFYIGSRDLSGPIIPFGLHDEFRVFGAPFAPGAEPLYSDGFERTQ